MKVSFDNVSDTVSEFPLIPEGRQLVTISEITETQASSGGKNLQVKLTNQASNANSLEFLYYQDASGNPVAFGLSRIKRLLMAVGTMPAGEVSMTIVPTLLAGGSFYAEFKHTTNQAGKTYSNVGNWETLEPVNVAPVQAPVAPVQAPVQTPTAAVPPVTPTTTGIPVTPTTTAAPTTTVAPAVQQAVMEDDIDI